MITTLYSFMLRYCVSKVQYLCSLCKFILRFYLLILSVFISFQVISGQQLPKVKQKEWSIVDPLVRVEIYGVPLDQAKQETKYIDNNGEEMKIKWTEVLPNYCKRDKWKLCIVQYVLV